MRVYSQSFGFNMHRHIHFVTTNYKKMSTQLSLGLFGDVSHTHTHTPHGKGPTRNGWAEPAEEETQTGRGTWTTSKTRYRLDSLGSQENCIGPLNPIGFSLTN